MISLISGQRQNLLKIRIKYGCILPKIDILIDEVENIMNYKQKYAEILGRTIVLESGHEIIDLQNWEASCQRWETAEPSLKPFHQFATTQTHLVLSHLQSNFHN